MRSLCLFQMLVGKEREGGEVPRAFSSLQAASQALASREEM